MTDKSRVHGKAEVVTVRIEKLRLVAQAARYRAALEKIISTDYRGNEPEWYRIAKEALRD